MQGHEVVGAALTESTKRCPGPLHLWDRSAFLLLVCSAILCCCDGKAPRRRLILQDGTEVAILEVTPPDIKGGVTNMRVDYTTELSIRDYVALVPQVTQVWSHYRRHAERRSAGALLITAHDRRRPDDSTTFDFIIGEDGQWQKPEVLVLHTGKRVVISGRVRQSSDQAAILFVDYVTDLPMEGQGRCQLGVEVLDVWAALGQRADALAVEKAFVCPNSAPVGGSLISFSLTRGKSGVWEHHWPDCPDL